MSHLSFPNVLFFWNRNCGRVCIPQYVPGGAAGGSGRLQEKLQQERPLTFKGLKNIVLQYLRKNHDFRQLFHIFQKNILTSYPSLGQTLPTIIFTCLSGARATTISPQTSRERCMVIVARETPRCSEISQRNPTCRPQWEAKNTCFAGGRSLRWRRQCARKSPEEPDMRTPMGDQK